MVGPAETRLQAMGKLVPSGGPVARAQHGEPPGGKHAGLLQATLVGHLQSQGHALRLHQAVSQLTLGTVVQTRATVAGLAPAVGGLTLSVGPAAIEVRAKAEEAAVAVQILTNILRFFLTFTIAKRA